MAYRAIAEVSEPERADRFAKMLFGRSRESRNDIFAQPGAADRLADRVRRLGGVEDGNEDHVIISHSDDLERSEPEGPHLGETFGKRRVG